MTVHASQGPGVQIRLHRVHGGPAVPDAGRGEAILLPDGLVNERLPDGDAHAGGGALAVSRGVDPRQSLGSF